MIKILLKFAFRLSCLTIFLILFLVTTFLFGVQTETQNEKDLSEFQISAGVVPHHLLAKELIENFFSYVSSKGEPQVIILLSPDHFESGIILKSNFITLSPSTEIFQDLRVDQQLIRNLSLENKFVFDNFAIKKEHGILNLLPFIKKHFSKSKIVPILVSQTTKRKELDKLLETLNSYSPEKTLVLASVDFSHYLPKSAAQFHDVKSKRVVVNFEKENFENLDVDSWQALYLARGFANLRNKESPKIIDYKNSADFLKEQETERTTSYFNVVF